MKRQKIKRYLMLSLSIIVSVSIFTSSLFGNSSKQFVSEVETKNDPNFKILANSDKDFPKYNKKVNVFGIDIYAVPRVENNKLLHVANVLAQYLDNDEDGKPDNQAVVNKLVEQNAVLVMWEKESDLPSQPPYGRAAQDVGNDETNPNFVRNGRLDEFDAALEEVLHLITVYGYAKVYPEVFGEQAGTEISNAMDIARGGHFDFVPNSYPAKAWYSYDDETCEYNCQIAEYHYWALTSILGAQENRLEEIDQEWKLNTVEKVEQKDKLIYKLLTNEKYMFPKILPDGTYRK